MVTARLRNWASAGLGAEQRVQLWGDGNRLYSLRRHTDCHLARLEPAVGHRPSPQLRTVAELYARQYSPACADVHACANAGPAADIHVASERHEVAKCRVMPSRRVAVDMHMAAYSHIAREAGAPAQD